MWSVIAVLALFLNSDLVHAVAGPTPTLVLQRCCCTDGSTCGSCTAERCCGATTRDDVLGGDACKAGEGVCLDGDRGGTACADFLGPQQFSLAVDASGNLFAASRVTNSVFRVTPGGCVTKVLGPEHGEDVRGPRGLSVSPDGSLFIANGAANTVFRVTPEGEARKVAAQLNSPLATAVDKDGNVFVSLATEPRVVKLPAGGGAAVTVLDGSGDGAGKGFRNARGIAVDTNGVLYAASESSNNVFRVTPDGARTEILSQQRAQDVGVELNAPFGVAVDAAGNVFVTGFQTDNVVRVTPGGDITELMRGGVLRGPREVAVDAAGRVYVTGQVTSNLVRLSPDGSGWTHEVLVQGTPRSGTSTTGLGPVNAILTHARGLAVAADGRVFVAGGDTNTVHAVATAPSACGDGVVGEGEACDWARPEDRCCCTAQCQLADAAAPCNDGVYCNGRDRCGDAGACSVHADQPCALAVASGVSTGVCNEETGACDPLTGPPCADDNVCDGPSVLVDDVCTPTNVFAEAGVVCAADDNPCTHDQCDGHGSCVALPGNEGKQCAPATDCRDAAECTADSADCPIGKPKREGLACDDAVGCPSGYAFCESGECVCYDAACGNGVQDPGEQCGEPGLESGACCSNCRFLPAGTVCRGVESVCDVPETCSGASAVCPADAFAPPDTACSDDDPCTADRCHEGRCEHVPLCEVSLLQSQRTVGPRGLERNARAATVLCRNLDPLRSALTCSARALVPGVTSELKPDACMHIPGGLVSKKSRRSIREFLGAPNGEQEAKIGLVFNRAARRAIMAAFKANGVSSVLVCIDLRYANGSTITLVRELVLLPNAKLKTRLPDSTPP
jgi:sugar lactone lactonase YvrE